MGLAAVPGRPRPTVVYKAIGGIGTSLMNAINLAFYSWRQQCRFAMDMRACPYFDGDAQAGFFENLEIVGPPGFEVVRDPSAIDRLYRRPGRAVCLWQEDCPGLNRPCYGEPLIFPEVPYAGRYTKERGRATARPPDPWPTRLRRRLKGKPPRRPGGVFTLALKGRLRAEVEPLLAAHFTGPTIGVHFRHGNGEFLHSRFSARTFDDYDAVYRQLLDAYVARVRELQAAEPRLSSVFIASDNARFIEEMRTALPGAFALPTDRPERPYQEHLRGSRRRLAVLSGAVADLFGLARCERVVSGPTAMVAAAALLDGPLTESGRVLVGPSLHEALPEVGPRAGDLEAVLFEIGGVGENEVMAAYAPICSIVGDSAESGWVDRIRCWTAHVHDPVWQEGVAALRRGDLVTSLRANADARAADGLNPFLEAHEAALLGLALRFEEAELFARRAIAHEGRVPRLHRRLAWVLERQGRFEEAIGAAGVAAALRPQAPRHLVEVARLQDRAGLTAAAEASYRRAIAIDDAVQEHFPQDRLCLVPEAVRWVPSVAAGA